jgi:outer membrane protein assembly factor BamB
VGSEDGNVYCLNATTGLFVWDYTTGDFVDSSPAVVGGLVYVGSYDDNVYCLNAANGTQVWNYTTGNFVESSPAVVGGLVYIGSADANVYCLNAATGALVWSCTLVGSVSYSSPAVVNGVAYIGSEDGNVYALGPSPIVPEFPPYLILPLFMMTTLLAAFIFLKRKRNVRTNPAEAPFFFFWRMLG